MNIWLKLNLGGLELLFEMPNPVCYDLLTVSRIKVFGHESNKMVGNKTRGQLDWAPHFLSASFRPSLMFVSSHTQLIFWTNENLQVKGMNDCHSEREKSGQRLYPSLSLSALQEALAHVACVGHILKPSNAHHFQSQV